MTKSGNPSVRIIVFDRRTEKKWLMNNEKRTWFLDDEYMIFRPLIQEYFCLCVHVSFHVNHLTYYHALPNSSVQASTERRKFFATCGGPAYPYGFSSGRP